MLRAPGAAHGSPKPAVQRGTDVGEEQLTPSTLLGAKRVSLRSQAALVLGGSVKHQLSVEGQAEI